MTRQTVLASLWLLCVWSLAGPVTAAPSVLARTLADDALVGPAAGIQREPAIARGADGFLAVWSDMRSNPSYSFEYETSEDIYGVRLDPAGMPIETVSFAITQAPGAQGNPKVAWNGTNWLVVFETTVLSGTGSYYQSGLAAVRVSAQGQVLDAQPIPLHGAEASGYGFALASDGNNWVVVNQGSSTSNDLLAWRIAPSGVVLDPPTRSLVPATYY